MKNIISNCLLIIAMLAFSACTNGNKATTAEEINTPTAAVVETAKESSGKLAIAAYLELKEALVESSAEKAKEAAIKMKEYFASNPNINASVNMISESNDLELHRVAFENISLEMWNSVKENGAETTLYKQHCPMAFGNKGAYWLSDQEEIRNPYFGDKMLKCGSVKETIAANE
jgi:hypothetical protein